jgi:hypothetical protein
MAGSDLHRAMGMLNLAALEEQGLKLGVETLLSELRISIRAVCDMEETSAGVIELMQSGVRLLSIRLCQVLEEVLTKQQRVHVFRQVSLNFPLMSVFVRPRLNRCLKRLRIKVTQLEFDSRSRPVSEQNLSALRNSSYSTVVGKVAENMVEKMVRILLVDRTGDDGPLFLPIAGGPGSGKTVLAHTLFNDDRVMGMFVLRAWVHVSPHFGLSAILLSILTVSSSCDNVDQYDQADLKRHVDKYDQADLKRHVRETLSGTRYLLVLDDVWSESEQEWRALMQALPSNGTVIVTTRVSAAVCCVTSVGTGEEATLEKRLHSRFVHLWTEKAAKIRCEAEIQMLRMEEPDEFILQSAHASYFHLPLDLRKCLLYCSMFPFEYKFDPEELADLLAAEGLISPTVTHAQRRSYLQKLFDVCFHPVEKSGNATAKRTFRMYSILHRFARLVDKKISGTVDNFSSHISRRKEGTLESVKYLSTQDIDYNKLRWFKKLNTLIVLQRNSPDGIKELPRWFFKLFQHLRILNLKGSNISSLPKKFGMMSNLRYLNLSWADIENIPSFVSKLQNLQTLVLSHCEKLQKLHGTISKLVLLQKLDLQGCCCLMELPSNMGEMKSLQYLNVQECSSLKRMPYNLGQLANLQTMLGYVIDGRAISELQSLENLKELSLECLENISDVANASDLRLEDKQQLDSLVFQWNKSSVDSSSRASEVLDCLRPNEHLRTLDIVAYEGIAFPTWMTSSNAHLISLVEIRLVNMKVCQTLPPLGLLPLLKTAEISGAEAISSISDSFYGQNGTFPSLKKLIFSNMPNLELWEQPHYGSVFPCLQEVTIIQCPKLALRVEPPSVTKLILWMNNQKLHSSTGALGNMAHILKHVSISFCHELRASSYCEGLQDLCSLKGLELCGCDEMTCLPRGLQQLSSLRSLTIVRCGTLESLPDWLENLPYLRLVRLSACPMLHSVPESLRLRHFTRICIEDCPNLKAQSSGKQKKSCIVRINLMAHF